jgi:hypothetical protein
MGQRPEAKSDSPKPIQQPIPFSHKKHCDLGLGCDTCHKQGPKGENERIPTAADCMDCHQSIKTGNPDVQSIANYAKGSTPIPWVRIYTVPDFVHFSHKAHLDAKFKCEECHGPVGSQDVLAKEKDFTMKTCIGCHRVNKARTGCDLCHKLSM